MSDQNFESFSREEIYDHRKSKFLQIGRDYGFSKSSSIGTGGLSYKDNSLNKVKTHFNKNKFVYIGFGLVILASLIAILS